MGRVSCDRSGGRTGRRRRGRWGRCRRRGRRGWWGRVRGSRSRDGRGLLLRGLEGLLDRRVVNLPQPLPQIRVEGRVCREGRPQVRSLSSNPRHVLHGRLRVSGLLGRKIGDVSHNLFSVLQGRYMGCTTAYGSVSCRGASWPGSHLPALICLLRLTEAASSLEHSRPCPHACCSWASGEPRGGPPTPHTSGAPSAPPARHSRPPSARHSGPPALLLSGINRLCQR